MEVNTIPNFWKNSGGPDPTPKAPQGGLKRTTQQRAYIFFKQYWIYGYQNDRDDPLSHEKKFERDRIRNKRSIAENLIF